MFDKIADFATDKLFPAVTKVVGGAITGFISGGPVGAALGATSGIVASMGGSPKAPAQAVVKAAAQVQPAGGIFSNQTVLPQPVATGVAVPTNTSGVGIFSGVLNKLPSLQSVLVKANSGSNFMNSGVTGGAAPPISMGSANPVVATTLPMTAPAVQVALQTPGINPVASAPQNNSEPGIGSVLSSPIGWLVIGVLAVIGLKKAKVF